MAESDGSGGIRQFISFVIRKASLDKLVSDTKQAAATAANAVGDQFAAQVTPKLRQVQRVIQETRDELLRLVKIPPIQALDPKVMRQIKKDNKNDPDAQAAAIRRAQLAQQAANTTFTTAGRILNGLGVNVYKSSFAYQTLLKNIQNVGSGVPVATANFRGFINMLAGQGLSVLKSFAGQLGIVFSVYRIVQFARSAVSAAADTEAAWARLSSTLSDFGIPLSKVQGQIEAVVASQSRLGVKQQDTIETLATLINITGDYQKSLRAVTVVTDLMIARHFTQEQAARAVGRAMIGDNMLLSRQGIILDKNRDAIEQLTERMRGELAARAGTLAGKIAIVSSAFNDLKIAIGSALTGDAGNWASTLVDVLQSMTTWVKNNQRDFQTLAEVLGGVAKAVGWIGIGFINAIKVAETLIGTLDSGLHLVGSLIDMVQHKIETGFLTAFNYVIKGWDAVTGQHHDAIDKMIKEQHRLSDDAKDQANGIGKAWKQGLIDIWAPEDQPSGPKAPDFALGTAGKIQSRVQQKTHADIRQLGNIMVHGREDAAQAAAEELNKKLQEQEDIVSNLSQTDETRVANAGAIRDAESNIADIKKIQLQYDKRLNDNAAQRREDARVTSEIERLGRVARQADADTQQAALRGLDKIQASLIQKQSQQQKYGERWFLLQNQIDMIEAQRTERANQQDKTFKDQIDKLHDQLDLHVEEQEATQTLENIMADLNKQYADALKITNDQIRAEKLLHIAQRQRMVEQALNTDNATRNRRISQLGEDIQDPAKRHQAENELLSLSRQINNEMFRRKTLNIDITELENEQRTIQQILLQYQHTSAAQLSKEIQDAKRLGRHWVDKQAAAKMYQKVIDDINSQLDGHIALTDEERAHLELLLKTAEDGLNNVNTMTGNFVDEWKQLWAEAGDAFIENVAGKITDAWTKAAELMLWDLKDIKRAATTAFQGMGKAFASEIKNIAMLRVKQHIAEAVSEGAEAIKALAEHRWHDAALHAKGVGHQLAAAAKWAALAGAAGNIGGQGVSSAAGGGGGGNTGSQADNAQKQGPIIYLRVDGMDPANPRHQALAGAAVQNWQEVSGGAIIQFGTNNPGRRP